MGSRFPGAAESGWSSLFRATKTRAGWLGCWTQIWSSSACGENRRWRCGGFTRRLQARSSSPAKVLAELLHGAAKSAKPVEIRRAVESFVAPFAVLWPTLATVEQYVRIRAELESKGTVIGEADFWIAAAALTPSAVLVTNNAGEFFRVPGLTVEDWTRP